MGLFDFASNIGNKVFGSGDNDAEVGAKIVENIEAAQLGIENLQVAYADGSVTLSGDCNDPVAVEKAVLIAGNMEGVKEVINNTSQQELETEQVEYYVIQSGDTLSKISKAYYGDAMAYNQIFDANREVIQDPDLIFVGQKIRIPQLAYVIARE